MATPVLTNGRLCLVHARVAALTTGSLPANRGVETYLPAAVGLRSNAASELAASEAARLR